MLNSSLLRRLDIRVLMLALVLGVPSLAWAQDINNKTAVGFPENGVFTGSNFDSVQLSNGNLHIEIPLWSTPGRGLSVAMKYVYDNKGWHFSTHCVRTTGICTDTVGREVGNNTTWRLARVGGVYGFSQKTVTQTCSGQTEMILTNRVLRESDGTKHHMLPDPVHYSGALCPNVGPANSTMYAEDGSGWMKTPTGPATRKDGVQSGSLDTNGNQITSTDTLGRTIPTGGSYYDSEGVLRQITVSTQSVAVQTALCSFSSADGCNEDSGTWTMPYQFTLPNGLSYTFTYAQNQYGEPLSVTLPTGGQISWTWNPPVDGSGRVAASRTVVADGQTSTWTYSYTYSPAVPGLPTSVIVTDPLGNQTKTTFAGLTAGFRDTTLSGNPSAYPTTVQSYQGPVVGGTLLRTVQTTYDTSGTVLPVTETTTLNDVNLVSKVTTTWQTLSTWSGNITWKNPLSRWEYGYGTGAPGGLVRKTVFTYLGSTAYRNLNIADRPLSKTVYDGAGAVKAQTQYTYDGTTLTPTSGAPNHDYTNYGASFLTRGNVTQVKSWLNTTGTWLITNNAYDDLGNLRTSTDPGGHLTTYSYTDDWANASCVPAGVNTQAYVTQTTNHLSQRSQSTYYPCTGQTQSTRDENDILASRNGATFTYDLMNRALSVVRSDGGQTDYTYDDTAPLSVTSSTRIDATQSLISTTLLDSLGRAAQTQLNSDPEGTVYADTTYDALGRTATASNPYRSGADPTYGITSYQYDALGRVTLVIPPDGSQSANNVSTVYSGNCVTVTDQAGKKRKSCSDALGRLTQVFEPDAAGSFLYETAYQYDTLDNLIRVDQKGNDGNSANWRTRTFTYDSLSRLLTATNPESGTINYTYDADSNLVTKVAPAPNQTGSATLTTTYAYDPLHRLEVTYYDGTPTVAYYYDQTSFNGLAITNGIGRRTGMSDPSGQTAWSYDSEGRALTERRTIAGVLRSISYSHNLDGSLASLTYPSGRVVNYAYNAAARPLSAIDTANSINYATAATYAPQGALAGVKYGVTGGFTGIVTTNTYNPRLQPVLLSASAPAQTVLSFSYGFGLGTANNGNVLTIQNNRVLDRSQTFTYDQLNRVLTAKSTATSGSNCWGENFGYDIWGNLLSRAAGQGGSGCTYEALTVAATTKNQISGFCYDSAGNLLRQSTCGANDYTYDAENRISTTAGVTYTYDGDGERVKKSSGTLYWTGTGSDALAESDLSGNISKEFIFFGGKRIARLDLPGGAVHYYFSDHLGSSNVVTSATGTTIEEESDFYPFGGERVLTDLLPDQRYKFTGKERDPESGLDYFGARYYSSSLGRFITPDEFAGGPVDAFSSNDPSPPGPLPYADIANPQSLNKYAYTYNNPLRYTDPDGHIVDTLLDIGFTAYSASAVIADVITQSDELGTDLEALGADAAAILVPGVTGAGMAVRAAKAADKVSDAAKIADKANDIRRIAQEGAEREAKGLAQAQKNGIKLDFKPDGKPVKAAPHDTTTGRAIRDDKGKTSIFDGIGKDNKGNKVGVEVSKKNQSPSEQRRKAQQAQRQQTLVKNKKSDIKKRVEIKVN